MNFMLIAVIVLGAYRNLQMWAYNGGNLSEEDSIALYGALD